jgi:PAS domain S-box-containing protein
MPAAYAEAQQRLIRRFAKIQQGASLALILLGAIVIIGWIFDLHVITTLPAGLSTMKFNTALGFVLTGTALYGLGPSATGGDWKRAQWLALPLLLLATVTLLQYPLRADFGIDNLFYRHPFEPVGVPGRMSGFTAIAFLLIGAGLWVEVITGRRGPGMTQVGSALLFLSGLLGVLGFIYRAPQLLNFIPGFGTISLHASLGILVAALAFALVRPDGAVGGLLVSPSGAGQAARNLFLQIGGLLLFIAFNVSLEQVGWLDKGEAAATRNLAIFSVMLISGWKTLRRLDGTELKMRGSLLEVEAARANLEGAVALRTAELAAASLRAEASRAQLASVMASTPALVAAVDTEYRFTVVNDAYAAAILKDQGISPAPGMHYDEIYRRDGEYKETGRALWSRALSGERFSTISTIPQPDGSTLVYERDFGPIVDQAGRIVGAVGLLQDITAQRELEIALERQRRLLDGIMTHGDAAIFVKDANHRYVLVNPRYGRMLGRSVDELIGRNDSELLDAARAQLSHETDDFVLRERTPHQREVELEVPGEGTRHFLISKVPIPSDRDGEWLVCGMSLDITARKEAEAALEEAAHHLRITLDSAEVGLWDWDMPTGKLRLDRNWKLILGYGMHELPDSVDTWRATIHPDDAHGVQSQLNAHLASPERPYEVVYRARHKDGRWIWVSSCGAVAERDATGCPVRMTGVIADVHRLKEAENLIQERNRDLETLLHVTSHDLREPLRAIESFSRMTRERYAESLDQSGRDYLDRVIRAAGRMNGLIDDIMRLSKARRAKVTLEPVDTASLIDEVLGRLEQRIQETGGSIRVAGDLPPLVIDRSWVTQAVYNLVANGLKFSSPGVPPEITISGYHENGQAGLMVADRGPGVDEEHRERIFELFQRAVGRDIEGSGAGLAIVQQVAARHEGRAWVQPREGGGSEFVITFGHQPSARAEAQPI